MNIRWKALASITVAAALVIGPLAATGAAADDTPLDPTSTAVEVATPVEEAVPDVAPAEVAAPVEAVAPVEEAAPAEPAPSAEAAPAEAAAPESSPAQRAAPVAQPSAAVTVGPTNEGVCPGVHITPLGDVASFVYTAPAGYRISAICVKAGSIIQGDGPEVTTFDPPVTSVTISHPSGKAISHYSVTLVRSPYYEPIEVTPTLTWTPPTCDGDGTLMLGADYGYHWEAVLNDDGSTTYTAVADHGYEFPDDAQTEWTVPDLSQLPAYSEECYEPVEVTPTLTWTPPTCDGDGSLMLGDDYGYHWEAVLNDDGSTTYTAVAEDGYEFPDGAQTEWTVPDLSQLPADSEECYEPVEVTPTLTWTPPTCETTGEITFMTEEGVEWALSMVEPDGDTTYTASPEEGYFFPEDAQTVWVVPKLDQLDPNDPECVEVYPVPAFFNTPTPAPTCATAAEFVTPGELIANGEVIFESDDVTAYSFANVDVWIWRDVAGEVYLEVLAHDGFTLEGLNDSWDVSEDGTYADRTIVLAGAIGYQNDDPAAPCFFDIVPQPAAPTFTDLCGTENDSFDVPADTDDFEYVTVHEGPTVTINAVLLNPANEWAEGTETSWSHTFTDEECPLIPGGIGSRCIGSVPYLGYAFTLPEGFVADSATPLTITFVHPSDPAQSYSVENQPLSGAVLWPGASATTPQQWPGWVRLANGTYVETTGNYAWTRPTVTVRFDVNPSYQTTVAYPAESALCANPANPSTLAVTGGQEMGPWGIAGLAFVAGGLALLYTRRLARR